MNQMETFFSNRVEILFHELKQNLFSTNSSPFMRRLLVVPSPAMKSWLTMKLAEDQEIGIAAGLEISYLDNTLQKLQPSADKNLPLQLNKLEIAFAIENELRSLVQSSLSMDQEEYQIWRPLFDYLNVSKSSFLLTKKMSLV